MYKEMEKESMTVCIEFACNSKCITCMLDRIMHNLRPFSFEEFVNIIKKNQIEVAPEYRYKRLILSGAEVTLHPELIKFIKYAKENGHFESIQLQTNGRKLSDLKFCQQLKDAGINELFIPLLGHNAELHDKITQVQGSYDETISGLKNAEQIGITVMINTIMTTQSYKHLPKIVKNVSEFSNVKSINFWNYWPMNDKDEKGLLADVNLIKPFLIESIELSLKNNIEPIIKKYPACLLGKYSDRVINCLSRTFIDDKYWNKYNNNNWDCIYSKSCNSRQNEDGCSGLPVAYFKKFGWEEETLRPIQDNNLIQKFKKHKEIYGFKKPITPQLNLLKEFEQILKDNPNQRLECSCKIENSEIHPMRFNIWFNDRKHGHNLKSIKTILQNLSNNSNIKINYSLISKIINKKFDFPKVSQIIFGIDIREQIDESRVKLWFIINNYKEKADEIIELSGYDMSFNKTRIKEQFLFGFDFKFDGTTKLKIYPVFMESDLKDKNVIYTLRETFSEKIINIMKMCKMIHISYNQDNSRTIHFQPKNMKQLIELINNPLLNLSYKNFENELNETGIISLEEKEMDSIKLDSTNQKFRKINLYY